MTVAPSSGKPHLQATPEQIIELRERLDALEVQFPNIRRHRSYLTDRVLHRFLTSRNGNIEHAVDMLLSHLDWRVEEGIDGILDEDLSHPSLSKLLYWSGFDLVGHPCLVVRPCEHYPGVIEPSRTIRYFCQLMERAFEDFAPASKFCLILDCRGVGRKNMDLKLMKAAAPVIENNYPERQHSTYVLPCNGFIMMAWRVISTFIDPGTANKIRMVSSLDDELLMKHFSKESIEAIITVNPSISSPQPQMQPDPLNLEPPPNPFLKEKNPPFPEAAVTVETASTAKASETPETTWLEPDDCGVAAAVATAETAGAIDRGRGRSAGDEQAHGDRDNMWAIGHGLEEVKIPEEEGSVTVAPVAG
ncbi:unnamed protein product, partial [Discosporangium mesarthrocarpum]